MAVRVREVDLGVVSRGEKRRIVARLANTSNRSLHWSILRTSCECLSAVSDKHALSAADDAFVSIYFDAGEDAGFVGNLAMEVTAHDADGTVVFRFDVLAEVVPAEELAFCNER